MKCSTWGRAPSAPGAARRPSAGAGRAPASGAVFCPCPGRSARFAGQVERFQLARRGGREDLEAGRQLQRDHRLGHLEMAQHRRLAVQRPGRCRCRCGRAAPGQLAQSGGGAQVDLQPQAQTRVAVGADRAQALVHKRPTWPAQAGRAAACRTSPALSKANPAAVSPRRGWPAALPHRRARTDPRRPAPAGRRGLRVFSLRPPASEAPGCATYRRRQAQLDHEIPITHLFHGARGDTFRRKKFSDPPWTKFLTQSGYQPARWSKKVLTRIGRDLRQGKEPRDEEPQQGKFVYLILAIGLGLLLSAMPAAAKKKRRRKRKFRGSLSSFRAAALGELSSKASRASPTSSSGRSRRNPDEHWLGLDFTAWEGARFRMAIMKRREQGRRRQRADDSTRTRTTRRKTKQTITRAAIPLGSLEGLVTSALFNTHRFELIERKQIDAVLAGLKFNTTDLVSGPSASKVGRLLGAQYMLFVEVAGMEGRQELHEHGRLRQVEGPGGAHLQAARGGHRTASNTPGPSAAKPAAGVSPCPSGARARTRRCITRCRSAWPRGPSTSPTRSRTNLGWVRWPRSTATS